MAVRISVPYIKTFQLKADTKKVYGYLTQFEEAVPKFFPGVEKFEPLGSDSYRWTFKQLNYGGHSIGIKLATRFKLEPEKRIVIIPIKEADTSDLAGEWVFAGDAGATQITFRVELSAELPIPFFLKGMATPIAQKELSKLFDRYISNVEKHFST